MLRHIMESFAPYETDSDLMSYPERFEYLKIFSNLRYKFNKLIRATGYGFWPVETLLKMSVWCFNSRSSKLARKFIMPLMRWWKETMTQCIIQIVPVLKSGGKVMVCDDSWNKQLIKILLVKFIDYKLNLVKHKFAPGTIFHFYQNWPFL